MLKTWTTFLEQNRLLAFTLVTIRDEGDFKLVAGSPPPGGNQVTLSRFMPVPGGFEIWIDFQWHLSGGVTLGTIEGILGLDGQITNRKTIGVVYRGSDIGDLSLKSGIADTGM